MTIPLGEREGQRLEFKAASSLSDPGALAKDVVGLLNAEAGDLWIGLREENECAVALESVPDPDVAIRSLRDFMLDSIEPSPDGQELRIEAVRHESGRVAIRIAVRGGQARRPYAYLQGTARHYLTRVGTTLRPLTRADIIRDAGGADQSRAEAEARLRTASRTVKSGLWVALEPMRPAELDLHEAWYEALLMDPKRSGNREIGWQPANPYKKPDIRVESLVQETKGHCRLTLRAHGSVELVVPKPGLAWRDESLYPLALLEYPTSVLRLAKAICEHVGLDADLSAQLGLFEARGLALRPGSPRHAFFKARDARVFAGGPDVVMNPRLMTVQEILEGPDRCAARLWREVYAAFGFGKDAWPSEYDEAAGRFEVPNE